MTLAELSPHEVLPDRPFTDLRHVALELHVIRFMATCTWLVLEHDAAIDPAPAVVHQPTIDGWIHRIIITQPARLRAHRPLTVVGFFGLKSHDANVTLAQHLDRQLMPELSSHTELLAYVSTCLPTGNFGNLVLFASPQGKEQWGGSELHAAAVRQLTPEYYTAVRLYNGTLADGLGALESLRLDLVKYYDYRSHPMWRAVRRLSAEVSV